MKRRTKTETIKAKNAKLVITKEPRKRKNFDAILSVENTYNETPWLCKYVDEPMPYYKEENPRSIYDCFRNPSPRKAQAYNYWKWWLDCLGAYDISVRSATRFFFDMTAKLKIGRKLFHINIAVGGITIRPIDKNLKYEWELNT